MIYDVAIVGAGMGGLALARQLQRQNRSFVVLEQSDHLSEAGAALSLWPNGLEALEALGISAAKMPVGALWKSLVYWSGNQSVARFETARMDREDRNPLIIHRGRLLNALLDGLDTDHIQLRAHVCRVGYLDDVWLIEPQKGKPFRARFLVGADGWRSCIRDFVYPDSKLVLANYICVRAVVRHNLPRAVGECGEVYVPGGVRFGYFPCDHEQTYWFAFVPKRVLREGALMPLLREHAKANALCALLTNATAESDLIVSEIGDMRPKIDPPRIPVALLGDAAHPMHPSLGQGAALALEDAVSLAGAFETGDEGVQIAQKYVHARARRWQQLYEVNHRLAVIAQSDYQFVRWLGLAGLRYSPSWAMEKTARRLFSNELPG